MQRFLVRRFLITIVTLFAVSIIIFAMARVSGDPRTMMLGEFVHSRAVRLGGPEAGAGQVVF